MGVSHLKKAVAIENVTQDSSVTQADSPRKTRLATLA